MNLSMKPAPADENTQPSEATRNRVTLAPMTQDDLDAVIAIEQTAYSHPWTRGNFRDSLNPLFEAQCLWLDAELLGYFLAMHGVEEMHLLLQRRRRRLQTHIAVSGLTHQVLRPRRCGGENGQAQGGDATADERPGPRAHPHARYPH